MAYDGVTNLTVERRVPWALIVIQAAVVASYAYGVVAYLGTDARFFPEQSPPVWSYPAVVATAVGLLVAVPCVFLAVRRLRVAPSHPLLAVTAASVVMVLVMVTPPGWEIFDWYVS
ncbi:hypothetical protein ACQPZJ_36035 [Actinoplanes sp. CA-054009]